MLETTTHSACFCKPLGYLRSWNLMGLMEKLADFVRSLGSSFHLLLGIEQKTTNQDELPIYSSKQPETLKSIKHGTWLVHKFVKRIILRTFRGSAITDNPYCHCWASIWIPKFLENLKKSFPFQHQISQLPANQSQFWLRLLRYWKVCNWYLSALSSPEIHHSLRSIKLDGEVPKKTCSVVGFAWTRVLGKKTSGDESHGRIRKNQLKQIKTQAACETCHASCLWRSTWG